MSWSDASKLFNDYFQAEGRSEWAGIPMPLPDHRLITEKNYPYKFDEFYKKEPVDETTTLVNSWWNERLRCRIYVGRENGKSAAYPDTHNAVSMVLGTMMCSDVWPLEAESKAIHKLAELIRHNMFRCYMLTGCFLETSPRSGVTYMFRKSRPTLAIRGDRVLAGLCLHPVGYYDGTWAGCMVPTDEVIAHLVLMRGDEHHFWKQANQHPAHHPASGL